MCGIAGVFHFGTKAKVEKDFLKKMANVLEHRGPDADGFYEDGHCGLAFRRLAIIDLKKRANQPLINKQGTFVLVFNGEIYNFKDLRRDLEGKGYHFETETDGEVILHGYAAYGEKIVHKLRGMFAFAIWDTVKRKLFLARDRVGKKPLFYFADQQRFVFASEMKALLQDPNIPRVLNSIGLWDYLSYGYIPSPNSIFKDIQKLEPGHYLTVDRTGPKITQYWDLRFSPTDNTEQYYIEQTIRQLNQAVRIRMISDVPLGAFLSGGIDSSSVVAFMTQHSEEPIKTFSIGFEESAFNEIPFARMIAERYHTDHREFVVKANTIKILPQLIWHYDEPYADSSALPSYILAQLTRKQVTVALNGDGGDESFAGYHRYVIEALWDRWGKLPKMITAPITTIIHQIPERTPMIRRAKRFVEMSKMSKQQSYMELMQIFDHRAKQELCTRAFAQG
ncbi:MAG TPA: asparagine synthase (glutamine-hydrolyzing), partial [Candidatus Nanoarchaeia archaeon]|nr:asparagine synthase (glutamine-hydrolyzing) [Candidatus Nanoarchaeia archaeon]